METIIEALEKEITRGNCKTCKKRYKDPLAQLFGFKSDMFYCSVTEEPIGFGGSYCELT